MLKKMSEYEYHYGLKVRLYPSTKQKQIISASSNASRFVYNKMVEIGKEIAAFGKPSVYVKVVDERLSQLKELRSSTTVLKNRFSWLCVKEIDTLAIANAKQSYNKAWNMYRKVYNISPPNFHKKSYEEKYQTSAQYDKKKVSIATISNGRCKFSKTHVSLPVLGRIRYVGSRKMMEKLLSMEEIRIGTITVMKDNCGDYYASFQLASDEPFVKKIPKTDSKVGIDLNVENFYADSNGVIVDNPHYYRKAKKLLVKAQRKLGKRTARAKKEHRPLKTANNYQKQRILVARIAKTVMNRRRNFLHIQSTALINNHDLVVAEELRSRNMMKNHALASSIQDNGWRTFLNMMEYKAELYGKEFKTVNPRNTTQTCHCCGHIMQGEEKLSLSVREWTCPSCGARHVRDINAAINILQKGLVA
jgi:putative transposase